MKNKQNREREAWMTAFETISVSKKIYEPGRVDWYTAQCLYSLNLTVYEEIDRISKSLEREGRKET